MGFYSITAMAPHPIGIRVPLITLDRGFNAFTALTDDIAGLKAELEAEGVEIREVNRLDDHEPVAPEDSILLPGESPEAHLMPPREKDTDS